MKNVIATMCFAIVTVCLMSCSNNDEIPEKKQYEFESIKWCQQEGDGVESYKKDIPSTIFSNPTSEPAIITISPIGGIKETSQFFIDQEVLANLSGEELVCIPHLINTLTSEYIGLQGGPEAPFQTGTITVSPTKKDIETMHLPPHCKVEYTATIEMKKLTATYRAHFVEKNGSDSYDIEGKWEGHYINFTTSTWTTHELK